MLERNSLLTFSEKLANMERWKVVVRMIAGEKVIIKGLTKASSAMIYQLVNREELRPLTGTLFPVSEYEHEEWIRRVATSADQKLFLVCDKETEAFLGTIGLKNFDRRNQNAELFISLDSPGGFGADAVSTLTGYCFERLNLHRVYLHVFSYNRRAIRCYEKAGFQHEGVLKSHHFEFGRYVDVLVMAKIRE